MDQQQAQKILDGLRGAAKATGNVVELTGVDARNFAFVGAAGWSGAAAMKIHGWWCAEGWATLEEVTEQSERLPN